MEKSRFKTFNNPRIWIVVVMAVIETVCGLVFKQKWYRMVPLYISLIVMMFQTKASRYAFLIGGLNAIIYALVDISMKVYGGAMQCLLFSCPVQILTFISWGKRPYRQSTQFKKLSQKGLIAAVSVGLILWLIIAYILSKLNSPYLVIDSSVTVLNFFTEGLCLLTYVDYIYPKVVGSILSLVLSTLLTVTYVGNITFLVACVYNNCCTIATLIYTRRLYKEQQLNLSN